MPYRVNISISHNTLTSMPPAGRDYKSKPPYTHVCLESVKRPANTSLTVTVRAPDKWLMPDERNNKVKPLMKMNFCLSMAVFCLTGTASSVFTHSPFRFPLVKYIPLPSLEVGFLKYTPMKTEAPEERETWRKKNGNLELESAAELI